MSGKPVRKDILKSVDLDAIKDTTKAKDDITRVYKNKNSRVKKELDFKTKKNNTKLA
ncbi:hypothetical protein [Cellulophaga omnivescoria]|uniref:hypothetical protein n=1 Tax=Cellulophaga omnivescoria TaxID=1888890 RepID=UPI0015C557B3|nr:hypothetical protein [Cellulophaga omnivescoria]WBU87919.1 hypothetical protein PBN93_08535 [Cellulophaga omnivescoria]